MMNLVIPPALSAPGFSQQAVRKVTCQVTRNGEQTESVKYVRFYRQSSDVFPEAIYGILDGYELEERFAASAFDGSWYVEIIDQAAPPLGAMRWPTITQDSVLRFNLSDDSGSGGGDSAVLDVVVRVDGELAEREVVVVERQVDGTWRVAGTGLSSLAGEQAIELKVTPSSLVYAFSPSPWGFVFQPSLLVEEGDLVRPTVFMGWIYQITQAGQLPAVEPTWWDDSLQGPQPLGTARAEVHRYYPPQGRGPIPVELI